MRLRAAVELLRPNVCIMAVLGLIVASIILKFPIISHPFLDFFMRMFTAQFILAAAAAFLICGGGNAINDYFDYKIDKINMPKRPIPSGRIGRRTALLVFWSASIIGLAFSLFVNIAFFSIALFNFVVSSLYAWKLKRTLIKGVFVSYLGSSAFISAAFISGFPASILGSPLLVLVAISFFGTLGRQLLMDIRDMQGDRKAGAKTIPLVFGKKAARITASLFLLVAVALLAVPYFQKTVSVYYLVLAIPAILLSLYAVAQEPAKGERTVKKATFLVLFAFLMGAVL